MNLFSKLFNRGGGAAAAAPHPVSSSPGQQVIPIVTDPWPSRSDSRRQEIEAILRRADRLAMGQPAEPQAPKPAPEAPRKANSREDRFAGYRPAVHMIFDRDTFIREMDADAVGKIFTKGRLEQLRQFAAIEAEANQKLAEHGISAAHDELSRILRENELKVRRGENPERAPDMEERRRYHETERRFWRDVKASTRISLKQLQDEIFQAMKDFLWPVAESREADEKAEAKKFGILFKPSPVLQAQAWLLTCGLPNFFEHNTEAQSILSWYETAKKTQ